MIETVAVHFAAVGNLFCSSTDPAVLSSHRRGQGFRSPNALSCEVERPEKFVLLALHGFTTVIVYN